jgi:hypothetical protein
LSFLGLKNLTFASQQGNLLEQIALQVYGVAIVNVLSSYMQGYMLQEYAHLEEPNQMGIPSNKQELAQWVQKIGVDRIEGIICESDSGLADAEEFGVQLHLFKHNGVNEARRNKFLMIQAMAEAGLEVVRQRLCTTVEEAVAFARELGVPEEAVSQERVEEEPTQQFSPQTSGGLLGFGRNTGYLESKLCVVKPPRGAASESVHLCHSLLQVRHAFDHIFGDKVFGSTTERHESVLVQQFAAGTEYALDIVSRNGEHKVAAVWRYDKRPANGRSFVYHATELVDAQESICEYALQALNVLGIRWGMTHTEIILTKDGCRLVEVNCRQHNMDFSPLTMACIGYNALDMLLAALLGDGPCLPGSEDLRLEWSLLPDRPVLRAHGAMVHLVNHAHGKLVGVNEDALNEIQAMESVLHLQVYPHFLEMGNEILATIDIRTDAGWVQLINDDAQAFAKDYNRIVELMPTLFVAE